MKTPTRKPPKKQHPKQKPDRDLTELAQVLDEYRLDNNAAGWFTVPWRDGWNAVFLAHACWDSLIDEAEFHEAFISSFITKREATAATYYLANECLQTYKKEWHSIHLYAALRCLQVTIANSSGGGVVYNDILKAAFDKTEPAHLLEEIVLEHRCRDAIGTTSVLQSDKHDRQRRAFAIAWRRGLYLAAYSIQPVRS